MTFRKLDIIQSQGIYYVLGGLCISLMLFAYSENPNSLVNIAWVCVQNTLGVFVYFSSQYLSKNREKLTDRQIELSVTSSALLLGISWAVMLHLFLITGEKTNLLVILFIVFFTCIPAIGNCYFAFAYIGYIACVLASFVLLFNRFEFSIFVQMLPVFMFIYLASYARRIQSILIDSIKVDIEKGYAIEDARQANNAKTTFIASASHDIRQPLQAVQLFISALKAQSSNTENETLLERLQDSADSMSDILNSLLDISKLDANAIDVNPRDIVLAPLLDKLHDAYLPLAKNQGLTLDYTPSEFAVYTDPILLERIISNLLSNALRYTQEGFVKIETAIENNRVIITVKDSGLGIAEEDQKLIFDEFYQLGNPERDRQKGIGLGLAIVKKLSDLLEHTLSLNSKVGSGTEFKLELPLGDSKVAFKPKAVNSKLWNIDGHKILIVDDDEAIRTGLQSLLQNWGCEVQCAESIADALDKVRDWMPQLIISDYSLREQQTGVEAIALIQQAVNHTVPAMIITGDTNPERIKEAKSSGYVLLHKPVKPGQIRAAIQRLLRKP